MSVGVSRSSAAAVAEAVAAGEVLEAGEVAEVATKWRIPARPTSRRMWPHRKF